MTSDTEVAGMISATEDRFGGVDILVNNAGGTGELGFPDLNVADWEACLRLNLHAPMLTIQAALPAFARLGGGSVVNVSSVGGVVNGPYPWPEYAAAKACLLRLTDERVLAEFFDHYDLAPPHQGIEQRRPREPADVIPLPAGPIERRDRLGGLLHEYSRTAA